MPNVLIDTQTFESLAFDFTNDEFSTLLEYVGKGRVNVFISSIIDREVRAHLAQHAQAGIQKLQTLIRQNPILRHAEGLNPNTLLSKDAPSKLAAARLAAWDSWKVASRVQTLPNDIDVDAIIDAYFDVTPPFGGKGKKYEFPDAITLSAAVQWCRWKREKLAIISSDGDLREFCEGRDDLEHFDTLTPFLERQSSAYIVGKVKEGFEAISADIFLHVQRFITEDAAFVGANVDALEVGHIQIHSMKVSNVAIVFVDNGNGIAEVEVKAAYSVDVSFPDPRTGSWDYESGEHSGASMTEQTVTEDGVVLIAVTFVYDEDDPTQVTVMQMSFNDANRPLRVDLSENDDEAYDRYMDR